MQKYGEWRIGCSLGLSTEISTCALDLDLSKGGMGSSFIDKQRNVSSLKAETLLDHFNT